VLAVVPAGRPGDFAQALMDLGATICTPRNPACALCPWRRACVAAARGSQSDYPVKPPKKEGALRRGTAFVLRRGDGAILLRTRPDKGLLGGMSEVPTSAWVVGGAAPGLEDAPVTVTWRIANTPVRHVFTHFPLELTVCAAPWPQGAPPPSGHRFMPEAALAQEALPTVMRKVIAAGLALLGEGALAG
jgi:A/G-specific adenine glycosylase